MDKKIIIAAASLVFSLAFASHTSASCNLVSGKTYYTDGVSNFTDSACREEMIATGSGGGSTATGYISTGNANCRYSLSKMQYTDGVTFFTDNKCTDEALNGKTAPAPSSKITQAQTQTQIQTQTQTQTGAINAAQYDQLSQKIGALEQRMNVLMSILTQVLALLAKK